jgi:hypothetical protein
MFSEMARNRRTWPTLLVFLLLISVPYLLAALASGSSLEFRGFLINYQDGYSYLGKLRQGFEGQWLFRPDYTSQVSSGIFIFTPYLLLGHLAKVGGALSVWLHFGRVISAILLFFALQYMIWQVTNEEIIRWRALWMVLFGSGMGWLIVTTEVLTPDFWVAEAYPFLASYTNLHFPLGLALQVWLLIPKTAIPDLKEGLILTFVSALLGLVSAFSVPVILAVWGGFFVISWLAKEDLSGLFWRGVLMGLGGGSVIVYDYWAILRDPVLAGWNAQNTTPSPHVWELVVAFCPALIAVMIGFARGVGWKQLQTRALVAWLVTIPLLVYMPFPLQRRFLVGYFIPTAILAVVWLHEWAGERAILGWRILFGLSLPTNTLILLTAIGAIISKAPEIYLPIEEAQAFKWMTAHLPEDAVVAAAPETGLMLPGYTPARVVYGHPFESLNAIETEANVITFFQSLPWIDSGWLASEQVDFIYIGRSENGLCGGVCDVLAFPSAPIYDQGGVKIYAWPHE